MFEHFRSLFRSASGPSSAAHRVLNTPHLLESILCHLDCIDLLASTRISSSCQRLVQSSPSIRRKLWLHPPHGSANAASHDDDRLKPNHSMLHPIFNELLERHILWALKLPQAAGDHKLASSATIMLKHDAAGAQYWSEIPIPRIWFKLPAYAQSKCRKFEIILSKDPIFAPGMHTKTTKHFHLREHEIVSVGMIMDQIMEYIRDLVDYDYKRFRPMYKAEVRFLTEAGEEE